MKFGIAYFGPILPAIFLAVAGSLYGKRLFYRFTTKSFVEKWKFFPNNPIIQENFRDSHSPK